MEEKIIADNKSRLNWIDWAKSIGIYIVILCHTPQYPTFQNIFFCSFQMPLFFLISRYLHKNTSSSKEALKKYWTTLIVPYLLFQIIFYPYWYIVQQYDGNDVSTLYSAFITPLIECLMGIPINRVTWFIVALLIIKLYANVVLSSQKHCLKLSIISCIIIIGIRYLMYVNNDAVKVSYAIDSMLIFSPFFFLGYFCKKYDVIHHILNQKRKQYILLISFLISIILLNTESLHYSSFLLLFYLKGISGSLFILSLCMILNSLKANILYTISSGTILIFGLHWMFIGSFNFFLKQLLGIHGEIQYSSPIAMLIAGIIIWINYYLILLCKKHFPIILGYRK